MSEDATAAPKLNGVLYGKQTQLSLQSFTRKARRLRDIPAFVRNYALVKRAAAQANLTLGRLDEQRALAIIDACDEIADGSHLEQFPTALLLGGGGTTSNMNLNEVIASRASQIGQIAVHPNDHANASQSTNDTFPTAMTLTLMDLAQAPLDALHELTESLCTKAQEYADTPYLGRTCLQDAVTVYAGQTLRGQARAEPANAYSWKCRRVVLVAVRFLGRQQTTPASTTQSPAKLRGFLCRLACSLFLRIAFCACRSGPVHD